MQHQVHFVPSELLLLLCAPIGIAFCQILFQSRTVLRCFQPVEPLGDEVYLGLMQEGERCGVHTEGAEFTCDLVVKRSQIRRTLVGRGWRGFLAKDGYVTQYARPVFHQEHIQRHSSRYRGACGKPLERAQPLRSFVRFVVQPASPEQLRGREKLKELRERRYRNLHGIPVSFEPVGLYCVAHFA